MKLFQRAQENGIDEDGAAPPADILPPNLTEAPAMSILGVPDLFVEAAHPLSAVHGYFHTALLESEAFRRWKIDTNDVDRLTALTCTSSNLLTQACGC
ncbi:unnamed protein product, partial [Amoebophrya sp. A25]